MIDLHVHTTYSDGTFTPSEVVRYAKEKGLTAIAITDHDCVFGVDEAQETGNNHGIEVISGVELSVNHETHQFHMIGLMIDVQDTVLKKAIEKQIKTIEQSTERLFDRLIASGFNHISFDEFRTQGNASSKGHYKQYMASANISTDVKDLEKYIGKDGIAYALSSLRGLLTFADAIDVIHSAGGLTILAHPLADKGTVHKLGLNGLEQTVASFKAMNLDGFEAYYRGLTQEEFKYVCNLADKHQLLVSVGSDFHGDTRYADLGTSYQNEKIPYSVLNSLKRGLK